MKNALGEEIDVEAMLLPETALEREFLTVPEFHKGLFWGKPRFGHPEGQIVYHIREVLDNVEQLTLTKKQRERLRIITFVHDTFKYKESRTTPRDWSKHHSILARQFVENYTDDQVVLKITESHDEAYYAWQLFHIYDKPEEGTLRLKNLLEWMGDDIQLYYLFFKCDTCTGDKNPAPLKWFEKTVPGIEVVRLT